MFGFLIAGDRSCTTNKYVRNMGLAKMADVAKRAPLRRRRTWSSVLARRHRRKTRRVSLWQRASMRKTANTALGERLKRLGNLGDIVPEGDEESSWFRRALRRACVVASWVAVFVWPSLRTCSRRRRTSGSPGVVALEYEMEGRTEKGEDACIGEDDPGRERPGAQGGEECLAARTRCVVAGPSPP